jgi:YbbR domain-containing protein
MLRWIGTNLRTLLLAFILALAVWVSAVTAADPDETRVYPTAIPIEFVGQDPQLISTGQVPATIQVTLRAPRSVWDQLTSGEASLHAVVDMTGLGSGAHTINIQLQISAHPIRVISVSPRTLNMVLEPLETVNLPVELTLNGSPAIGYQVGEPSLSPGEVVVSGPQSVVSQVAHVNTSLDLSNARQSLQASLPLQAVNAAGAALVGVSLHPDTVTVNLPLSQQGGYRDLAVKVVTVGQPASGYRLTSVAAFPPLVTVYSANPVLIEAMPGYVETTGLDLSGKSDNLNTNLNINLPSGVTMIGDQSVVVQVGIAPIEGSQTMSYRPVEVTGLGPGLLAHVSPATVDVILSGPVPVLDALLISDVHVQVKVDGLGVGTYQLTPTVKTINGHITIDSILPGTVEVTITSLATSTP